MNRNRRGCARGAIASHAERTQASRVLPGGGTAARAYGELGVRRSGFQALVVGVVCDSRPRSRANRRPSRNTSRSCIRTIESSSRSRFRRCWQSIADSTSRSGSYVPTDRFVTSGASACRRADSGMVQRFVGTGIDVTEQEGLTRALRKSEEELRQMLDLAPQLSVYWARGASAFMRTELALDYYGVTLDEWRQGGFGPEVHPDDYDRVKALVDRSLSRPRRVRIGNAAAEGGRNLSLVSGSVQPASRRPGTADSVVSRLYRYRRSQAGRGAAAAGKRGAARRSRQGVDVRRDCRRLAGADRRRCRACPRSPAAIRRS